MIWFPLFDPSADERGSWEMHRIDPRCFSVAVVSLGSGNRSSIGLADRESRILRKQQTLRDQAVRGCRDLGDVVGMGGVALLQRRSGIVGSVAVRERAEERNVAAGEIT